MATTGTTQPMVTTVTVEPGDPSDAGTGARAFLSWSLAAYLASVGAIVALTVWWLGGRWVYVLDDPAIHVSVASRLAEDGTWGVAAGSFESASSSPLWTVLLAGCIAIAPAARELWPLALNVVAGVAVLAILSRAGHDLVPGRRRPLDAAATTAIVVLALFLPGLAVVGMEHTLHMALVLGAVALATRGVDPVAAPNRTRWVCVLLALAALTRFETAFVAAGLATGVVAASGRAGVRRAAAYLGSTAAAMVAFGVFNRLLGGGWLPNSVLVKGHGTGANQMSGLGVSQIAGRFTGDPLLAVLVVAVLAHLFLSRDRSAASTIAAITLVVATAMHAAVAEIGWYERYQAYLIAIGIFFVLGVLARCPAHARTRAVALLTLLVCILTVPKAALLARAPLAADNFHRHQYQAGRFLDRHYDGQPIATDQLGYISLFHDGPITDFAGLGDYEVLRANTSGESHRDLRAKLADERGFRVAVIHSQSAGILVPDTWVLAGGLRFEGRARGGLGDLQFWATTTDEVTNLQENLREFAPDLPPRVELRLNEYAELQAMKIDRDG